MVETILAAVIEHRLPPGTKLAEEKLALHFGVNRARIRQVFDRLAHDGIVTRQHNRGAFVSEPSAEDARELFAVRRLIEPAIVHAAAARIDRTAKKRLDAHLAAEAAANRVGDVRALIRLTGEFHLLLADLAGNSLLARLLRELETRTSLIIFLYDRPHQPSCRGHDHVKIAAAVLRGDGAEAARLMLQHLDEVEKGLDVRRGATGTLDLAEALVA